MRLYILIVSEYDGPTYAYDGKPLVFTDPDECEAKGNEIDSDLDFCVYAYDEEVDCKIGDTLYVYSEGYYDRDEYMCKEVKFFKTDEERKAYASSTFHEGDVYESEYVVK